MRRRLLRLFTLAALSAACAVAGADAAGQPARRAPVPVGVTDFAADSGCSTGQPVTPTLSVGWRASRTPLASQRLEISAHAGGFDNGLFATLDPIRRGARTRASGSPNLPARFFRSALALVATSAAVDPGTGLMRVALEGLQPGLYYFVRVATKAGDEWIPGPTLRRQITPCITDAREDRRIP